MVGLRKINIDKLVNITDMLDMLTVYYRISLQVSVGFLAFSV